MALGLPHAYPFVFVDRVERDDDSSPEDSGNRAILGVTAGADTAAQNAASLPATLLLEAMAQATLALMLADAPEGEDEGEGGEGRGLLVGIDEATFDESLIQQPPRPGDRLVSRCEVRGRFGRMAKVAAWMERDGVRVASAEILLAGG